MKKQLFALIALLAIATSALEGKSFDYEQYKNNFHIPSKLLTGLTPGQAITLTNSDPFGPTSRYIFDDAGNPIAKSISATYPGGRKGQTLGRGSITYTVLNPTEVNAARAALGLTAPLVPAPSVQTTAIPTTAASTNQTPITTQHTFITPTPTPAIDEPSAAPSAIAANIRVPRDKRFVSVLPTRATPVTLSKALLKSTSTATSTAAIPEASRLKPTLAQSHAVAPQIIQPPATPTRTVSLLKASQAPKAATSTLITQKPAAYSGSTMPKIMQPPLATPKTATILQTPVSGQPSRSALIAPEKPALASSAVIQQPVEAPATRAPISMETLIAQQKSRVSAPKPTP